MKRSILLFWILVFSQASCGGEFTAGTSTGNPEVTVELSVVGTSGSASTKYLAKTISGGVDLTEARVVLDAIEFEVQQDCESETEEQEIDLDGPFVVDLLANESLPELQSLNLETGSYCEIKLKLAKLEEDEVPTGIAATDPIVTRSAVIRGTRSDNTPFVVLVAIDEEFKIASESGFNIEEGGINQFFIAFDLDLWFNGVDLDNAIVSGGQIIIDKDNNKSLLEIIEDNIKLSSKLFEDLNENGVLESSEATSELLLGTGELIN